MPRKKPWMVIVTTARGPLRSEHTSQVKAYEEVGASQFLAVQVQRIHIYHWEQGRWTLYEIVAAHDDEEPYIKTAPYMKGTS